MGGAFSVIGGVKHFTRVLGEPETQSYVLNWSMVGGGSTVIMAILFPRLTQLLMAFVMGGIASGIFALRVRLHAEDGVSTTASGSVSQGPWVVVRHDLEYNSHSTSFATREEAERCFNGMTDEHPCIVLSPSKEVIMTNSIGESLAACTPARFKEHKVEAMVSGKWVILQEISPFNVHIYAFSDRETAELLFQMSNLTRLLVSPENEELKRGGVNFCGWDTLRSRASLNRVSSCVDGQWMVLDHDGPGNIGYHAFKSESEARGFYKKFGPSKARLLLDPDKKELCSAGFNVLAKRSLRLAAAGKLPPASGKKQD